MGAPCVGAFGGGLLLGAGQVEGRGEAASGRLDLDQALGVGRVETSDVIARAVAAFLGGPLRVVSRPKKALASPNISAGGGGVGLVWV